MRGKARWVRTQVLRALGDQCDECKEKWPIECYELDHINGDGWNSGRGLRGNGSTRSHGGSGGWAAALAQIRNKGIEWAKKNLRVLCANHHTMKTYRSLDYLYLSARESVLVANEERSRQLELLDYWSGGENEE